MSNRHSLVLITSAYACFHLLAATADGPATDEQQEQTATWPADWLAGVWETESTTVTLDGAPSTKSFLFASHYIFISGYRFSIFKGRRIRATPMIGHTDSGEVLHCLFKMTNGRAAMRAEFSGNAEQANYVTYNTSSVDNRRYKLTRQLTRVTNQQELLSIVKATLKREFHSPHSTSAREILESWIADQERSLPEHEQVDDSGD